MPLLEQDTTFYHQDTGPRQFKAGEEAPRAGWTNHPTARTRGLIAPQATVINELPAEPVLGPGNGVEIPSDWESSHHLKQMALAARISGHKPKSMVEAVTVISAEMDRRRGDPDL